MRKIKEDEDLNTHEKEALVEFADLFISCSLKDPSSGEIVKHVNMHHHTKTCRKYGCSCRFYYPRFPTRRTIISVPIKKLGIPEEDQEGRCARSKEILEKVKKVLEDQDAMEELYKINQDRISQYKKIRKAIAKINFKTGGL